MRIPLLSFVFFCCFLNLSGQTSSTPVSRETPTQPLQVTLAGGQVITGTGTAVRLFRGIHYAEAPTGDLRWKPPVPYHILVKTVDATVSGCDCPQTGDTGIIKSEDCLTLNVFMPALKPAGVLPVMVWIHGGGFQTGSAIIEGEGLARQGVVLVSINYRLGVLGFLAHPGLSQESPHHSSGNYGLLDQIEALKWVQQNIASFNGDPGNVTVFGQSAGATSIAYLLNSPLAEGLFRRAILESPSRLGMPDAHLSQDHHNLTAMETIGLQLGPDITVLRQLPLARLIELSVNRLGDFMQPGGKGLQGLRPESHIHFPAATDMPFWVFADGWVVPKDLSLLQEAGRQRAASLLIGTNADEATIVVQDFPLKTEPAYREYLKQFYSPLAPQFYRLYPAKTAPEIKQAAERLITNGMFLYGSRELALAAAQKDTAVYFYRFTHLPAGSSPNLGVYHGAELRYIFGQATVDNEMLNSEQTLSKVMMSAWVNFARTGNPNGADVPQWPAFSRDKEEYLEIGDTTRVRRNMPDAELDEFTRVYKVRK